MMRAATIPETTAQTPVASVAARISISPGTYQIREESAPNTAAHAINKPRMSEA